MPNLYENPELLRKRAMVDALRQQGMDPQGYGGQFTNGHAAAGIIAALGGMLKGRKLDRQESEYRTGVQNTLADALRGPQAPADGVGPVEDKNDYMIRALAGNEATAPMALEARLKMMAGNGHDTPADILSFREVQKMNPEDRELFFQTKRGAQIKEIGGVPSVISGREVTPLSTLEREAQAGAVKEGAKTTAKESAEVRVAAGADLPRIEDNAVQMEKVLDRLDKSDLSLIYGPAAIVPIIPGTPQADVYSDWEQVQGKAFLEAFNSLKGGGQITEVEGQKATAAITSLSQRRQRPEKAKAAIADLRQVVRQSAERARKKAGGAAPAGGGELSAEEQAEYEELKRRFNR